MMYQRIDEAWTDGDEILVKVARIGGGGFNLALTEEDVKRAKNELRFNRPVKTQAQRTVFCKKIVGQTINISCLGENKTKEKAIKDAKKMASKKTVKVEMLFYGYDRKKVKPKDLIDKFTGVKKAIQDIKGIGKEFKGFPKIKTEKPDSEKEDELTMILSFNKSFHEKGDLEPVLTDVIAVLLDLKEIGNLQFGTYEVKE